MTMQRPTARADSDYTNTNTPEKSSGMPPTHNSTHEKSVSAGPRQDRHPRTPEQPRSLTVWFRHMWPLLLLPF